MPQYSSLFTPALIDRENKTITSRQWHANQAINRARELMNEIAKYSDLTGEHHPFSSNGVNHLVGEIMYAGAVSLTVSAQKSSVLDRTPHQIFWGYYDGGKNNWAGMTTTDPDSWDNHNEQEDAMNDSLIGTPPRRNRQDPSLPITRSTNNFRYQFLPVLAKLFEVPETVLDYWVVIPPESKHRGLMTHLYEYFGVNMMTSNKQYKHGSTSTTLAGVPNLDFSAVQFYGVPKKYPDTEFTSQVVRNMVDSRLQNRDYRIGDWYCTKFQDPLRFTDVQNHIQSIRHEVEPMVWAVTKTGTQPINPYMKLYMEPHWHIGIKAPTI